MNEFANHYLTEQQFPFSYCVVMEFIVYPFKFSIFFNSRKFVSTEHKKRHERRKIVQSAINIVHAVCCFICSKLPEYRGKVFRCRKGFFFIFRWLPQIWLHIFLIRVHSPYQTSAIIIVLRVSISNWGFLFYSNFSHVAKMKSSLFELLFCNEANSEWDS